MMDLEISALMDTEQFRNMVKQASGHPNYHRTEKGFEVYEGIIFSDLIHGNAKSIQYPKQAKDLIIRVHFHPSNYIIPSLTDLFHEFIRSFIQHKKGGSIPHFGILSVDNEYRQKGHPHHGSLFPELLVYSHKPLILEYGNLSKEEIGFKDLEEGNFAIETPSETLLVKTDEKFIPYEENIHKNKTLARIVADELQKKVQMSLKGIFRTSMDSSFDIIFDRLRNVETLELHSLKKYLDLI